MVKERIAKLRALMKENKTDAYIITTSDYHGSEYVGEYFKARRYMSGFTGSAGTLVVLKDKAALWTDGRYFIQAGEQLKNSGIELMKDGVENVPGIKTYLLNELKSGETIGFDGRTVSEMFAADLYRRAEKNKISVKSDMDLVDKIWTDRPKLSAEPVWELGTEYAGMETAEKLSLVREKMRENNGEVFVLSSLDDIAWLLNLRGNDVRYNPVFLSYMIIFKEKAYLYANKNIFSDKIKIKLAKANIEVRDYNDVYTNLSALTADNIILDKRKVNHAIVNSIGKDKKIIDIMNPTTKLKAVKTKTETDNEIKAHIKDGVAVTRFMYWLKNNVGKKTITEISAAEKIEEYRKEKEGYLGASFEPIVSYGAHGAIVHYSATEETDIELKPESFLLCDTGGQYYEGTTDITRTFALGELTEEQKKMYTLVLVGNLKLAAARFPYGVRGVNLDVLAREPLWRNGLDYNHGTGHGVGYLLNVHEGPNNISWHIMSDKVNSAVLEEGMITSDEPGIYIENQYGVRLENMILCRDDKKTECGRFMRFETLTMVPFDLDAVDTKYMEADEIKLLNAYHRQVYENISPYFQGEELQWLKGVTKALAER